MTMLEIAALVAQICMAQGLTKADVAYHVCMKGHEKWLEITTRSGAILHMEKVS